MAALMQELVTGTATENPELKETFRGFGSNLNQCVNDTVFHFPTIYA